LKKWDWNRVEHHPAAAGNIIAPAPNAEETTDLCSGFKQTATGAGNVKQRAMLSSFAEIFKKCPFATLTLK
jgi:hypothetical protein